MMRWPCALLLVLLGCPSPAPPPSSTTGADVSMTGVRVASARQGALQAVVTASHLELFRELGPAGQVTARDAAVLLPGSGLSISAPSVSGNLLEGRLEATGCVTVWADGGWTARAPRMTYDRPSGRLGSDAGVVAHKAAVRVEAQAFGYAVTEGVLQFEGVLTELGVDAGPLDGCRAVTEPGGR